MTWVSTVLYDFNNLIIQLSDQSIACQDAARIKSFATRTSTISGLFNLLFTLAYGIGYPPLREYLATDPTWSWLPGAAEETSGSTMYGESLKIYNTIANTITGYGGGTRVDCHQVGFSMGSIMADALEVYTDQTVFFAEAAKFVKYTPSV